MNIYKKLLTGIFLFGGTCGAFAQTLGKGEVILPNPPANYQTFLQSVIMEYNNFSLITIADYELNVMVSFGNKVYEVYPEVHFDEDIAWELGQVLEDFDWGNELIIDFSEEAYAAGKPEGVYTIDIPAGLVIDENGNTNEDQTITFTLVSTEPPVSVSPHSGLYPADGLKDIAITFSGEISFNTMSEPMTVRVKNDWINTPYYIEDYSVGEDGSSLHLDLSFLPKGVLYTLNVPEGFIVIDEKALNEEIWMEYMNWDGMELPQVVSAPDKQSVLADLKPFIFTWDYRNITFTNYMPDTELVIGYPDYGAQEGDRIMIPSDYYELVNIDDTGEITFGNNEIGNALYLDIRDIIEDYVGYDIEIFFPGYLVIDGNGQPNPPTSYSFELKNLWIDPEVTVEEGIVSVLWPYSASATYNLSDREITLYGPEGYEKELQFDLGNPKNGEVSIINEDNRHGLLINLNSLNLMNGEYLLYVPKGYLVIQDDLQEFILNDNVEYRFVWNNGEIEEAGIEEITVSENNLIIYDLQGRKMKVTGNLSGLRIGLYIINGKKVMIK